ncbi:hypothetical protein Tco_0092055, partial [Tanacetum coccineum]
YYRHFIANSSKAAKPIASLMLCTHAKRQCREHDSRNTAWPEPINGKEGGGMYLLWVPLIGDVRTLMMDEAHASRVEVSDKVMLEVSSWKDVLHFGKKDMLAPRYYWTDANLHVHVEEIKVDNTLHFAEEPVEIIDREVKSLKRSRILILSLEVLSKVGHIGSLADFSAPLNVLSYVSLIRKKFCWGSIFPIGLKRYGDPKEEPIEKEPLMELKEIGCVIIERCSLGNLRIWLSSVERVHEEDIPKTAFRTRRIRSRSGPRNRGNFLDVEGQFAKCTNIVIARWIQRVCSLLRRVESRIRLCTNAKRQGDVRTLMMDEAHASRYLVHSGADKTYYDLRDMYGGHKALRTRLKHAYDLSSSNGLDKVSFTIRTLWKDWLKSAEVGESGLIRPSWYKRQPTRVEVGDKVMLEVSSWKDVVHLEKKEMLALIYKYLADTNLHVHLEEIKVDKTFRFIEEPVRIIDGEVKV